MPSSVSAARLAELASHMPAPTISTRQKVVVTRNLGPVMPLLETRKDIELVVWPEDRVVERQWLLENAPGAAGIVHMLTDKVDAAVMDAAGPQLKVVSTMSVGYGVVFAEHIDRKEAAKRGIKVGYTPDVLTDAVADLSIMLALMAGRAAREGITTVNEGRWPQFNWNPFTFCGPQLSASKASPVRTAGFLGFGRIAQATLARLIPFGFTHCVYSGNPSSPASAHADRDAALATELKLKSLRKVDVGTVAAESDVVFVLAPGGVETKDLVNEAFLKKMKKTAILVNTSRGTLVDSDALAKALREGWIWAAGVDVVTGEPNITADHPLVKEPRCVVVPHIGSATLETRTGMATYAVNNALAAIFGEEMPASLDLTPYL